jgi:hypothetical protein
MLIEELNRRKKAVGEREITSFGNGIMSDDLEVQYQ